MWSQSVSLYGERSKKNLEKFYFACAYLRKSFVLRRVSCVLRGLFRREWCVVRIAWKAATAVNRSGKKWKKSAKKKQDLRKKAEKLKKREKNDTFLCKKTYKIAHLIQILRSMLKWVRFERGKIPFSK